MSRPQFLPYLSTPAGASLTHADWQALGIRTAVYDLAQLLMKPGLAYLQTQRAVLGWDGKLVLDASKLVFNKAGHCVIVSDYDGARSFLEQRDFWRLLETLQPAMVLLPRDLESVPLSHTTLFFMPDNDHATVYCHVSASLLKTIFIADGAGIDDIQAYSDVAYYASDKPAQDACQGLVYRRSGSLWITAETMAQHYAPIDPECDCKICTKPFTCAYLHYLYQSTPLLCQRLLLWHNIHCVQNFGDKAYANAH